MKTKKKMGLFAIALTALACALPGSAKAAGDIRSIEFYPEPESGEQGVVSDLSKPLVKGDKVKFKIRLANREWKKTEAEPDYLNPWVLRPQSGSGAISNLFPQIGLRVSGRLRFADIVSLSMPDGEKHHTDLICRYEVKAGDFALPLKLSNGAGTAPAMEADPSQPNTTPDQSNYFISNKEWWGFFPKNPLDNSATNQVEFYFGPQQYPNPADYIGADGYYDSEVRNYDLASDPEHCIMIKAVDFDDTYVSNGVWRAIAAGRTTATPAKPRLSIPGGASGTYTYYVWTKDSDVAEVVAGEDRTVIESHTFADGVTRSVAKVTVIADEELKPFLIKAKPGAAVIGRSTEVYMSDTPTNIYNRSNVLITNFTTRVITVAEPPPPSVSVVLETPVVSTSPNYMSASASLDVELSEPWPDGDLTVNIRPEMKFGTADPFDFIGMSREMSGNESHADRVVTVVIPRGMTKASETTGGLLWIYANRANSDTTKGIRFVPEIDVAASTAGATAFFTGDPTSASLQIDPSNPSIISPLAGHEYQNIPANTPTEFTIQIEDAVWQRQAVGAGTGKYTLYINPDGSSGYTPIPDLVPDMSGKIKFTYDYRGGGGNYLTSIYVKNQDGHSSETTPLTYRVKVNPPKKVIATSDKADNVYCEGDTAKLTFRFNDAFVHANEGYVFLEPRDAGSSNLVTCSQFDVGIPISVGSTTPAYGTSLKFLDGGEGVVFKYRVVVRTGNSVTNDAIAMWGSDDILFTVTNAIPRVGSLWMNNTPAYNSGDTLTTKAAVGVQNMFEIRAADPSPVDLTNNFQTVVNFWENGAVRGTTNLVGNPRGQLFPYTFQSQGRNKITVHVYDKDMTETERDAVDNDPFTIFVDTSAAPAISLSPFNSSFYFKEKEINAKSAEGYHVYVDLTVPPVGLGSESITVELKVERMVADDGNYTLPTLSLPTVSPNTYHLKFKDNISRMGFAFSSLDGTPLGASEGFRIRARVIDTTTSPDESKTWAQYYQACDDFFVYVQNEKPVIGPEGANLVTNTASINVPQTITWTASDIKVDQQQLEVTWTYNGGSVTEIVNMVGKVGKKEVTFDSAGIKTVSLMVKDKDGDYDTMNYYFYVAPSKVVEIHPRGRGDGISKFSDKFVSALGIGNGRVWADGADAPTEIKSFVHLWSYSPETLKTTVYARGYKYNDGIGERDDGTLTPVAGRDFPISPSGNKLAMGLGANSYFQYGNLDFKDSFFYCWILNTSGGDSGYEGSHLNGVVQPEVGLESLGRQEVILPEYDESAVTYDTTVLEAIFSLEYLKTDNLGDINQDGIPDVYAAKKSWRNGVLFAAAGFAMDDEEPGDLQRLGGWNDDSVSTKTESEIGDFLPAASSSGTSIIPTLGNWATAGGKFTAFMEIRGFHEGLNYRESDLGLNRNVRGKWVSEPDFSKAEWIAIAHHNPACGKNLETTEDWEADVAAVREWLLNDANANAWIPENRTDPTVDDTDEDGFPDGYEYYFWYKASVGEVNEKGEWVRLTGSRFTLNDIATGEVLTPEAIAAAFNPTVASAGIPEERDTDNDGLTDLEELAMGTNPLDWDTDHDGLSDYWEVMNGMNPLVGGKDSTGTEQGAVMNLDGDFMARWDSEAEYAVAKFAKADGSVIAEYALSGNPARYFDIAEDETVTLNEDAKTNRFVAISVYRYAAADNNTFVPRFRGGSVTNTVDQFGEEAEAKPLDALVWELGEATNDDVVVTLLRDQKVTLVHDQVRAQFGFDPRTGWYSKDGYVAARWKNASYAGDAGKAVNTVPYTALDEYLLLKYRYETNKESPNKLKNGDGPFSIEADMSLWNDPLKRRCADVFLKGTTAPNIAFTNPDWVTATATMDEKSFTSELHGADTDEDGVPDGWELYVGYNPNDKVGEADKDEDGDRLAFPAEYAGTDSCNAYIDCQSVYTNHPGLATGWYNKFFPTNPSDKDTDGDGVSDADEGAKWEAQFVWGNGASSSSGVMKSAIHEYSFIYGSAEGKPENDDGSLCIRGGGLNPCSVDTDGDCLPDPWERQFAGVIFGDSGSPAGSLVLEDGVLEIIRRSDGLTGEATASNAYITAGMDGTFGKDARTDPSFSDPATGTVRDFDFDHDGLQNYQEYLVQALRHLRYDDSSTPLMGQWMPSGTPASLGFFKFLPMNIMDGETFYASVKKAGFPATGAWNFRELGYFAVPPHAWDKVACDTSTKGRVNYDETGFRVMLPPKALADRSAATGYCSTDPRNWDSDCDGMDDYYELFHGLNPLLGDVTGGNIAFDLIAKAYGNTIAHWHNAWTGWPMSAPEDPVYDAMRFPWMIGTPGCDADGDGLNNYEETIYANVTSPQPTHTDPTPLWMTDSSSLNNASFVSQYYKMDCDALAPDFAAYPWGISSATEGFLFAFEENEGYDTDHDGINDGDEKRMTTTALSDSLNFADPDRRQAIWFSGDKSAAVSYACAPGNVTTVDFDTFRQFTVEAWINPAKLDANQVILERAVNYAANTLSNNVSKIRANFRLGIMDDGRLYGMYDSSDAVESDTVGSSAKVVGVELEADAWTHVALTFNGSRLALFMNGSKVGEIQTTLVPANGILGVTQQPLPGGDAFPAGGSYLVETRSALVLGASALDKNAVELSEETTWESYGSFYEGFIDEVRVWDGAKTETALREGYKTRLTVDDVKRLREEVYAAWNNGATRNDNSDGNLLPAELVFHYNFSTLPAAANKRDVMWEPTGFTKNVMDNVRVCGEEVPGDLYCGWWKSLPVRSKVYMNYRWVPWIPNMVSHLPPMDGSVIDSKYWSERLAGMCLAGETSNSETFVFPNTMNPYSFYHTFDGKDNSYYSQRLSMIPGNGSHALKYRFERRTTALGATDLLPLGGAFAKLATELWDGQGASDAWAYTGDDLDSNGLPDWWEEICLLRYPPKTGGALTLESLVNYNGEWMTAREAYLRDLAAGLQPDGAKNAAFKATSDRDYDGMPDWWENLYGLAGETGEDDHDGDGLSNYAEYLIAECFSNYGFPRVKPDQARTFATTGQLVPDFFLTKGRLYLGEMFADHDFMEDAWEDKFAVHKSADSETLFTSRYVNDMWADNDEDGWSNFAECRAGTDPTRIRNISFVSDDMVEYPVPTVRARVRYNGSQSVKGANLVLRSFSGASVKGTPDAEWNMPMGGNEVATSASGSSSGASGDTAVGKTCELQLGLNPGTKKTINLGSGMIVPGTVSIAFRDLNSLSVDEEGRGIWLAAAETAWCEGLREHFTGAEPSKSYITVGLNDSDVVGEINYETGDVTIDFAALDTYLYKIGDADQDDGGYAYYWSNSGTAVSGVAYERLMIPDSFVKIEWRGQVVSSENFWSINLARADEGILREGVNTFEAFLDVNGDGFWTPGEPYGIVTGVDVGWSTASFGIELTDVAPQMFRVNMMDAALNNDFDAQSALNDRGVQNSIGYGSNLPVSEDSVGVKMPLAGKTETRIRVIREAVNNVSSKVDGQSTKFAYGVALDFVRDLTANQIVSERDVLASGALDLDWGELTLPATALGQSYSSVTSVCYRVVLGDVADSAVIPTNNNNLATAFVNVFESGAAGYQSKCEPVSPRGTVNSAQPTFRWTHPNKIGKAYPAFRLRVWNGSTVVYDSGNRPAPVRDINGVYSWTAPIYADMTTPNGVVFANTNNYSWSVSMLDAKFTTPNASETAAEFRMEASGMLGAIADYGMLTAKVHYFGPVPKTADATTVTNMIRVQAFTSPDFTGMPAAEARVSDLDGLTSGEGSVVTMRGLPVGQYYVRAFIDTDADAEFDNWESWGYACYVNDGDAKAFKFTPKAFTVAKGAATPEAEVFIEDMDTDNDGYPDAWEAGKYGSVDARTSPTGDTFFTKVNPELRKAIAGYTELATGGSAMLMSAGGFSSTAFLNALLSEETVSSFAGFANLLATESAPVVSEKMAVKIESFSPAAGATVSVTTEVTGAGNELVIPADEATVGVYLIASDTVDFAAAASVKVKSLTIKANATTSATVSPEEIAAVLKANNLSASVFLKVRLVCE